MTRPSRALPIALLLVLAACTAPSTDASPSAQASSTPEATPSPSSTPDATPTESAEASETPEATPSASMIEGEGGFSWAANAEADALMDETFPCENLDDGYQVDFPAEWNANAEFGNVPPCSWFAPTEYETGDPGSVPDEVAIEISVSDSDLLVVDAAGRDRADGIIGATQPTYRIEYAGDDWSGYFYVVQLGRSFEAGPNLIASTTTQMGGDYELNKAVLDRMMQTMEFIGVIQ